MREAVVDWYSGVDKTNLTTWAELKKEFQKEFKLLQDDNEILTKIYGTKQGKSESIRAYERRLKELLGKMECAPTDEIKNDGSSRD